MRELRPCGTDAAYQRHRRRGEQPCEACRRVHNECRRQYGPTPLYGHKHGRFIELPLDWAKCGTAAQARAHLRRGEKPCDACRQAYNRYCADKRMAA